MKNPLWVYLRNPFDNSTKRNFKLMAMLSTDHHDKLRANIADPAIHAIYQSFYPIFKEYQQLYIEVSSNSGIYQGQTQRVADIFAEVSSTHIKRWDIRIQTEYEDTTYEYKSLLPNGRAPFQSGGYEARIREMFSLAERLQRYPNLADLVTTVRNIATQAQEARTEQQGYEQREATLSASIEAKRLELATKMHWTMASLMVLYINNIEQVGTYYELEYLHSASNSSDEKGDEEKEEEEDAEDATDGENDTLLPDED